MKKITLVLFAIMTFALIWTNSVFALDGNAKGPIHVYVEYGEPGSTREIVVGNLSKPSTIILLTYEPMTLKVSSKYPNQIKSIIGIGYSEPNIITKLKVPVYSTTPSTFESNGLEVILSPDTPGGYKEFCKNMKGIFGSTPVTVQYNYNAQESNPPHAIIDGIKTLKFSEPEFDMSKKMTMKLIEDHHFNEKDDIKYPENTIGFKSVWWASYYASNRAYKTGKHYFEVTMRPSLSYGLTGYTNIGVGTQDGQYRHPQYIGRDHDFSYSYGAISYISKKEADAIKNQSTKEPLKDTELNQIHFDEVRKNDVVGIALDLDNRRVYFSKNGVWINGNPLKTNEGRKIEDNRYYYVLGNVDCPKNKEPKGDVAVFNFNPKSMKYSIPKGYLAFGAQKKP